MTENSLDKSNYISLTQEDFELLGTFIQSNFGIKMPPHKKMFLESRLQKRLNILGINQFRDYIQLVLKDKNEAELINMVDAVSTNKTSFFREDHHFDQLVEEVLPACLKDLQGPLKIWSAAASSGEEPYTIAMVLEEYKSKNNLIFDYSIFGTDISARKLKVAINAIYSESIAEEIPIELRRKYLLRSKSKDNRTVRVSRKLRDKMNFKRFNLMDSVYDIHEQFDLVFCRNVLIYFERDIQEKVIRKICDKLKPGGYFFLGHSESIIAMDVPLKLIGTNLYTRI